MQPQLHLSHSRSAPHLVALAQAALEADMTGTLKAFTKGEIAGIAKEALKQAKKAKSEL